MRGRHFADLLPSTVFRTKEKKKLRKKTKTRDPGPPGHPGGLARWVIEFQSCSEFRGRTGQGSRLISGGGLRALCIVYSVSQLKHV